MRGRSRPVSAGEDSRAQAYTGTPSYAPAGVHHRAVLRRKAAYRSSRAASTPAATAAQAAELCQDASGDLDKVGRVFDFVVDHFTYDYDKASTVSSGYLPVVDDILAAKKGICFDYAAVMTAMLRSQNIPCKLVVGYAGTVYHAWIDVYVEGTGWIAGAIQFDGKDWTLMDPTFVSSGKRSPSIMEYVTTDSNYSQKYAY